MKKLYRVSIKFHGEDIEEKWNCENFYTLAYSTIEASNAVLGKIQDKASNIAWIEVEYLRGVWVP